MVEIVETIDRLDADPALRLVVLTGAGERAFVGGADINELAALDHDSARDFITLVHRCCDGFRRLPVPVIARIDGFALGAGLELAAACDLRVASDRSMFGMPEVAIGIPSVVEAALLPQLIGAGRARRLLLTGETIDAAEALAWGLVDGVAPAGRARRCGRTLRRGDPRRRPAGDPPAKGTDPRLGGTADHAPRCNAASTPLPMPSTPTSRAGWRVRHSPGSPRAGRADEDGRAHRGGTAATASRRPPR